MRIKLVIFGDFVWWVNDKFCSRGNHLPIILKRKKFYVDYTLEDLREKYEKY